MNDRSVCEYDTLLDTCALLGYRYLFGLSLTCIGDLNIHTIPYITVSIIISDDYREIGTSHWVCHQILIGEIIAGAYDIVCMIMIRGEC